MVFYGIFFGVRFSFMFFDNVFFFAIVFLYVRFLVLLLCTLINPFLVQCISMSFLCSFSALFERWTL